MARRHLTITAVAAGIGTAFTLALVPYASASAPTPAPAPTHEIAAVAASTPPDATPYLVGAAGFLLAGAGLVVVVRRAS